MSRAGGSRASYCTAYTADKGLRFRAGCFGSEEFLARSRGHGGSRHMRRITGVDPDDWEWYKRLLANRQRLARDESEIATRRKGHAQRRNGPMTPRRWTDPETEEMDPSGSAVHRRKQWRIDRTAGARKPCAEKR